MCIRFHELAEDVFEGHHPISILAECADTANQYSRDDHRRGLTWSLEPESNVTRQSGVLHTRSASSVNLSGDVLPPLAHFQRSTLYNKSSVDSTNDDNAQNKTNTDIPVEHRTGTLSSALLATKQHKLQEEQSTSDDHLTRLLQAGLQTCCRNNGCTKLRADFVSNPGESNLNNLWRRNGPKSTWFAGSSSFTRSPEPSTLPI